MTKPRRCSEIKENYRKAGKRLLSMENSALLRSADDNVIYPEFFLPWRSCCISSDVKIFM
jgi:hypothetical protein